MDLLIKVDEMVNTTAGLYDPTVSPILEKWKEYIAQSKVPGQDVLYNIPGVFSHINLMVGRLD